MNRWLKTCAFFALGAAGAVAAHHTDVQHEITGAWIAETMPGRDATAGFLVLENPDHERDALLAVECDFATTELHEMAMQGETMQMRRVQKIELPPGGKVELKPGGLHLMFFDVKRPLRAGETVRLRLRFERAAPVDLEVPIKAREGSKRGS